jgi:DNA-binding NarL/FixJ family response regulator
MLIPSDERGKFVTLLAHDLYSALQIQELRDIYGSTLILTNTQDETSIAIAGKLFNLIIVDTDLNGFGLVTLAKSIGCINYNTPIIALTDKADSSQRRHLIAAGFDDCLLKPLTADNLDEIVKFWRENDVLSSSLNSIQTLLAKCKNNRSLALALFNKLFEELPLQISCIEEALKNGQHQLAFDITHKLNGSAKICCLQDIEKTANALEECLIQKRYEYADGYFLMLQQRISVLINQRHPILDIKADKQ